MKGILSGNIMFFMKQNVPPVSLLENIQKVPLDVYIYLLSRNKRFVCCLYYPLFAFLHFCQNSKQDQLGFGVLIVMKCPIE